MLYEDTDSTILLRRTQTQTAATSFQHGGLPQRQSCCSLVTHHGLGSRSMPREEAFSMEGYHNASLALHRMHQDFSGLPLLSQPWQQAARNSPNASTLQWPASTFKFNSPNASTLRWPASTFKFNSPNASTLWWPASTFKFKPWQQAARNSASAYT